MILLKILGIIFLVLIVFISIVAAYVAGMRKGFNQLIHKGLKWGKLETSVFNNLLSYLATQKKDDTLNTQALMEYKKQNLDSKKIENRKRFAQKIKKEKKKKDNESKRKK